MLKNGGKNVKDSVNERTFSPEEKNIPCQWKKQEVMKERNRAKL